MGDLHNQSKRGGIPWPWKKKRSQKTDRERSDPRSSSSRHVEDSSSHRHAMDSEYDAETTGKSRSESGESHSGRQKQKKTTLVLSENQELVFADQDDEQVGVGMVNPHWRNARKTQRGSQGNFSFLSASPQELQLWLQQGGWRYVAGLAVLVIVLLVVGLVWSRGTREQQANNSEPSALTINPALSSTTGIPAPAESLPTDSVPAQPAQPAPANPSGDGAVPANPTVPTSAAQPPAPSGEMFVVVNTGTGLRLRADHNAGGAVLATIPDGTRVEKIDDDVTGANYVWRKVRTPDGREGWVAADWLQPAP